MNCKVLLKKPLIIII